MAFSFGAPAQPAAQPQTSLFGNTSTAAKPTFGGFSTPNPQQGQGQQGTNPPGTSLFGGGPTSAPATGGGLFGSTTQPQQQQNQQGQQGGTNTGGGLFGSLGQQPQGGSGLFGAQQPQQQQGQAQAQQQTQQASGGLFGSATTTQQPTSSLFGSTSNNAPKPGGLFGSTTQPQQGSSLFGQNQNQQSGGLFGSTPQQQPQGGLFGSTTQQPQQQQQGGGLFGSINQPQSQSQPQTSLFSSQSQPQQSSLFASTSNQSQNQNQSTAGQAIGVFAQKQEKDIEARMLDVKNAWDTNHPDCKFKHFFYNVVEPGTAGQYGRPSGATDNEKWLRAQRENPDPNTMVPVLATGWADVKKRMQVQENIASVHQEKINEISQALANLTRQTSLSSSIRLAALQTQLTTLLHRLLHLAAQTPQFIPVLASSTFQPQEIEVKAKLDNVQAELEGRGRSTAKSGVVGLNTPRRKAGGEGRMIGQVNELWGLVEEIRRRRKGSNGQEGWLGDEKALAEIAEILSTQQLALQKLKELVDTANFDADVIRQGLGVVANDSRK